ncbi:MAG: hypothetical protein JW959_05805, partial [Pirellulales bacterium]|nr:hypothetical protein [Pirellulales bacterium]
MQGKWFTSNQEWTPLDTQQFDNTLCSARVTNAYEYQFLPWRLNVWGFVGNDGNYRFFPLISGGGRGDASAELRMQFDKTRRIPTVVVKESYLAASLYRTATLVIVHRGLSRFSRFTAKMGLSPSVVKGTGT